jgi:hypothetical protein
MIDVATYLRLLTSTWPAGSQLELRLIRDRRVESRWFDADDYEKAADCAAWDGWELGGWTVAVGLQPRWRRGSGRNGAGTAEDIRWLTTVSVDVDWHGAEETVSDPRAEADRLMTRLSDGIRPSIVVASGRGLWFHFLLSEPIDARQHGALHRRTGQTLAAILGGDPTAAQMTRCARVPGTWNAAAGRRAEILWEERTKYQLDRLEAEKHQLDRLEIETVLKRHSSYLRQKYQARSVGDRDAIETRSRETSHASRARHRQALRERGLRFRERMTPSGPVLRIVGPCPICRGQYPDGSQGSSNTAWVTQWGRMKCWRPVCLAFHGRSPSGRYGGIPWVEWGPTHLTEVARARKAARAAARERREQGFSRELAISWIRSLLERLGALSCQHLRAELQARADQAGGGMSRMTNTLLMALRASPSTLRRWLRAAAAGAREVRVAAGPGRPAVWFELVAGAARRLSAQARGIARRALAIAGRLARRVGLVLRAPAEKEAIRAPGRALAGAGDGGRGAGAGAGAPRAVGRILGALVRGIRAERQWTRSYARIAS